MSQVKKVKPPIFRQHEEEELLSFIIEKAKKREEVKRDEVLNILIKYLKSDNRKNPFRNGVPGDKWFSLFRRRHNSHFVKLEREQLNILERIGFTEKVMNTVVYKPNAVVKKPTLDSSWSTTPKRKRKPKEFKEYVSSAPNEGRPSKTYYTPSSSQSTPESHSTPRLNQSTPGLNHGTPGLNHSTPGASDSKPAMSYNTSEISASPASDESSNVNTDDGEKSQESQSDSTDFQPGQKLEVMDFNDDKWYPVKVVEADYEEGEVLVHFEKWSNRYDEWVRMDSNRIRRPRKSSSSSSKKTFKVNEKVIAVWAYNHKYPATIRNILPNDKYEVLFCDGYAKILRGCKLFKATEEDLKNIKLPPPKEPAPPMGADPLDPNLGPKEERRLKKRRLDVYEALRPQKKTRLDTSEEDIKPEPRSVSPSPTRTPSTSKPKESFRVVLRGRPSTQSGDSDDSDDDGSGEGDDESDPEPVVEAEPKKRRRRRKKVSFDTSDIIRQPIRYNRHTPEEDPDRWEAEIPKGVIPVQIKDTEGFYRESIIVPDKKLPAGWSKHTMRRKTGVKWDVFLVNEDGRKFRSRNELRNFFSEQKIPFPDESFDFMVGRKMEVIRAKTDGRRKPIESLGSPPAKASPVPKKTEKKVDPKNESTPEPKKVKTIMPKGPSGDENKQEQNLKPPTETGTPKFTLAELRTPDGGYSCCGKSFRKENLFQMHMKHYHPEYSNLFGSTPNVADLAYARTVGEPLEDSRAEAMTPRNTLAERVSRYEAERQKNSPDALGETNTVIKTKSAKETTLTNAEAKEESTISQKEEGKEHDSDSKKKPKEERVEEKGKTEAKERETEEKKSDLTSEITPSQNEEKKTAAEEKSEPEIGTKEEEPLCPPPVASQLPPPPCNATPSTSTSLPVIKPVIKPGKPVISKVGSTEAVIVQTTSSPKNPVTITKYVPPGQAKSTAENKPLKVTISSDKEGKPTIKTLLPVRPPPSSTPAPEPTQVVEPQEPREVKTQDDSDEEASGSHTQKSRHRKRTVSEPMLKKPKLSKAATGSLEEETANVTEPTPSTSSGSGTSGPSGSGYRFSRNRSQLPRVSLEKLNVSHDSKGRVVVTPVEENDKTHNTESRRQIKKFKATNNISKKSKGIASGEEPSTKSTPAEESTESATLSTAAADESEMYDNLRKEEIINCTCGFTEEDGLMIQCDLCLCWQHGYCNKINKESEVPEKYVCNICLHPARQRDSMRHCHNQDWLKEGKLASFSFSKKDAEAIEQREKMLKTSHDLSASVLQLETVVHSLNIKTHIATMKQDHPKLYLWAKSWKDGSPDSKNESEEDKSKTDFVGPQPEAAIDSKECRLRLLEHIEDYQTKVEDRLTSIEAAISVLEADDPELSSDVSDARLKQTMQMLLRDLSTLQEAAALNT